MYHLSIFADTRALYLSPETANTHMNGHFAVYAQICPSNAYTRSFGFKGREWFYFTSCKQEVNALLDDRAALNAAPSANENTV